MCSTDEQPTTILNDHLKQCRICLDTDNPNDIISPCFCSGGSAFIHRSCLNHWRSQNARGIGFQYCDICHFKYVIQTILDDPKEERKRLTKYYCFIVRDTMGAMLVLQTIILILAWFLKSIDKNGENIKSYFPAATHFFKVYYLSALILFLAMIGLVALIISLCSNIGNRGSFSNGGSTRSTSSGSSSSRTSSDGGSSSVRNGSSGYFAVIAVVILIILALIGVFVGLYMSVMFVRKIMQHHARKLWLRQEAEKYQVTDFHGRRPELEIHRQTPTAPLET